MKEKKIMYDKAHLFLVLPGGVGSLDELMEVLTWKQLNLLNQKVIIFTNGGVNFVNKQRI